MATENLAAPADGNFVGGDRALKPEQVAEMAIDWNRAPAWAQYHAFDSDGRGTFHASKPKIMQWFWGSDSQALPSIFTLPTGINWTQTLVERPKAG